ncbi:MAG TPA: hypothetical protein VJY62_18965 [Bacteroidia bacterium]|nr:hypothetical protein [Bacteroidia bacterium]
MKNCIVFIFFLFTTSLLYSQETEQGDAYSNCLKKTSSKWADNCQQCFSSSNTYRVYLTNVCQETLDVKIGAQETTKKWRTFIRTTLAPGDSVSAYACVGTGKYIFWARKAGDKEIVFPTDEEINLKYTK